MVEIHTASEDGARGPDRFVRKPECRQITGLSDTTCWRLERVGQFPKRQRISPNTVAWRLSELLAWMKSRQSAAE